MLNCIFFKGTAKTNLATFLLKLMPFPNEKKPWYLSFPSIRAKTKETIKSRRKGERNNGRKEEMNLKLKIYFQKMF